MDSAEEEGMSEAYSCRQWIESLPYNPLTLLFHDKEITKMYKEQRHN